MFLAGGMSALGQQASANGNTAAASNYGAAAAAFIVLFTFTFGATWLTVPWLYPAEIFPLEVRAKGNAWGVFGWSIGNGWLVSDEIASVLQVSPSNTNDVQDLVVSSHVCKPW